MSNISGHQIKLDEVRSVFVGRSDDADGFTYIKLVNPDGEETRLKISDEAREALAALLANESHFSRDGNGKWVSA